MTKGIIKGITKKKKKKVVEEVENNEAVKEIEEVVAPKPRVDTKGIPYRL